MKFRGWLSLVTIVLLAALVVFTWPDIMKAFGMLDQVNLWILSLLIPAQILSYLATSEVIFAYIRNKGGMKDLSLPQLMRLSLEFNFVNHALPSAGFSGAAYLSWLLKKRYNVSVARSTMAQVVRIAAMFLSFAVILVAALGFLLADHNVTKTTVLLSLLLVVLAVASLVLAVYLIGNKARLNKVVLGIIGFINRLVQKLTRGKKRALIHEDAVKPTLTELHNDYREIKSDWSLLRKSFIWATFVNLLDSFMIYIAFWALGEPVSLAVIIISFGLAVAAGALAVTPGGAGVYEAVMTAFFVAAGVPLDVAIAGTLLARTILLLGTIIFGYAFYQQTIMSYGKAPIQSK